MTNSAKEPLAALKPSADARPLSVLEKIFDSFSAELSAESGFEEKAPRLAALLAREKAPNEVEIRALIEARS